MTTKPDTRLMPAQNPTDLHSTTGTDGEGVKAVGILNPRKGRKRAWDELSEIDRAVLLESVRQRRKAEQQQAAIYNEIHGMRSFR
jgi:hypothetical protein